MMADADSFELLQQDTTMICHSLTNMTPLSATDTCFPRNSNVFYVYTRVSMQLSNIFVYAVELIHWLRCKQPDFKSYFAWLLNVPKWYQWSIIWEKVLNRPSFVVKVKQSRYRLGMAQRVPGSRGSQITWQRHGMVVRLSALRTGRLYHPGNAPGTHFC